MNPDQPSREQIEARITALLLGELPADEAELLRWTISQDAELQKLHGRLLLTVGLVREVVAHPEEASAKKAAPRKLSDERRQKLLAHFKTPRPVPKELFWLKRIEIRPLVGALALIVLLGLLAAMVIPKIAGRSERARITAAKSDVANQMELGARIQAEENAPDASQLKANTNAPRAGTQPTVIWSSANLAGSVAATPPPVPALAPPPTEIVLPKVETAPGESEPGGVYSQHVVGYTTLAAPRPADELSTLKNELPSDRDQSVATVQLDNSDPQQVAQVLQNMFGNNNVARNGTSSSQNSALQQRAQNGVTAMSSTTTSSGNGGSISGTQVPVVYVTGGGGNRGGGGFSGGGRGGGANPFVALFGGGGSGGGNVQNAGTAGGATITVDPNTHNLVVTADAETQNQIKRVISQLDKPSAQRLVENAPAGRIDSFGVAEPGAVPETPSSDTTLAWNTVAVGRSGTESQAGDAWHGGALLDPIPNTGIGQTEATANDRLRGVSSAASADADALRNKDQVASAQNFYRISGDDTSQEKSTTLGDSPLMGRLFQSSSRVAAPVVAPPPAAAPVESMVAGFANSAVSETTVRRGLTVPGYTPSTDAAPARSRGGNQVAQVEGAWSPTAPVLSPPPPASAPEQSLRGFFDDNFTTGSGPINLGEESRNLPQSGGGTLALNGRNTFAGESVANAGTMVFHNFPADGVEATDKSSELNLGVAEPKQRVLTGFSFDTGNSGRQQSEEVLQRTPLQQRVQLGLRLPETAQDENNKLAANKPQGAFTARLQATNLMTSITATIVDLGVTRDNVNGTRFLSGTTPSTVASSVASASASPTLTQQQLQKYNDQAEAERGQPYWESKRKLDNLIDLHKLLAAKITSENLDLSIPKSTMVTIVDQAQPAQSQNFWQNLTGKVESKARIQVNPDVTDIAGISGSITGISGNQAEVGANYNPYSVQTEIETIQSDAVLGKVVDALKLDETWSKKNGGERLSKKEAIALLKKRLDLKPEKNTNLVEIGATSDKPEEAAKIANAVVQAYQDYCFGLRSQNTLAGVKVLEAEYEKSAEQIRLAQAEVDRLAKEANVAQPDKPLPRPPANAPIPQPEFLTRENAFSTFSMNVSDVSFKLAQASLQKGQMPDPASIRSEEFINAFNYRDPEAAAGQPLAFASERARDPFAHNRDFLRFSVKTAAAGRPAGRALNLVLLLDTSGSMERADRVAIIREALRVLAAQLQPQDTVSVVTFARTARLWADGVSGDKAGATLDQVGGITPDGGTNLEEAMRLAYETAHRHYLAQGANRVVLLTDGAANLGNVDPNVLKQKVEAQRRQGIALDCFGIGWEDFNDDLLEQLSGNGDGRYAFINSPDEAGTEFAAKLAGALQVAAQDVKVQVEFNPQRVISWRQIGYAKHQLTKEQFRDNKVLAAEIAAQEAGNALYTVETKPDGAGPIATVYVRYRIPGTQDVRERSWTVDGDGTVPALDQSSAAMRLAATAGAFSEWLAASPFAQEVTPDELLKDLSGVPQVYGADQRPAQLETVIREAKSIAGK